VQNMQIGRVCPTDCASVPAARVSCGLAGRQAGRQAGTCRKAIFHVAIDSRQVALRRCGREGKRGKEEEEEEEEGDGRRCFAIQI
jgi:hypothetical protein